MLLVLLGAGLPRPAVGEEHDGCAGRGTAIVVRTGEHLLLRCEENRAVATVGVSLGKGGTGKRRRGDDKTPLGTYPLGAPRPSTRFHLFVPVGYPTPEQLKAGYTGSAIGIHGPSSAFAWAGSLNRLLDWTQGCIALDSDEAIEELAAWVKEKKPALVHLE